MKKAVRKSAPRRARPVEPVKRDRSAPIERWAFSIREFCEAHSISVPMFYVMRQRGEGPRTMQVGAHLRISREAAEEWRRSREGSNER